MLSSFESFDELYTNRGLSTSRTIRLLTETVENALYDAGFRWPPTATSRTSLPDPYT